MKNRLQYIKNGLFSENPTFVQLLGMCPTLAITISAMNGLGMGLAVTAVLIGSNAVISLIKGFIPDKIRIPSYIVVIATFVTLIDMLMHAYLPALYKQLGLFIPLIVVNCIILGRAEAFASKHGVVDSVFDGLGMGLGFTIALTILSSVREILGAGQIFGKSLFGSSFEPFRILVQPPGAFLVLGLLIALVNYISRRRKKA